MEVNARGNYYDFSLTTENIGKLSSSKLETDKITLAVSDDLSKKIDFNTCPKGSPRNKASRIDFKISRGKYLALQKDRQVTCVGEEVYVFLHENTSLC